MCQSVTMKSFIVFLVLLVCTSGHFHKRKRNAHRAGFDPLDIILPRARCLNAIRDLNKFPFKEPVKESIEENVGRDEEQDPNPTKLPSIDSSNSIGFLSPLDIDLADKCFPPPQCDSAAKFRTIDGGCNNLLFPVWGQAHTANTRIIDADYSDGVNKPRKAVSGRNLPNVRHIRTTIFLDQDRPAPVHNLYLMQFGQIVAHDTELTLSKSLSNGQPPQCCNADGSTPKKLPNECLQITIPKDDPGLQKRCLSIPRAADTLDLGCDIKPVRQQIGVSSFVDASLLYGSDDNTARLLRTFKNGKLRRQVGSDGKSYLPNVKNATQFCNVARDNTVCYVSGDERVNQHPDMAVSTIALMRLHNVLCDQFQRMNPKWDDERLYQEARRLLIAMYQHITYNEFVPALIGRDFSRENKLLPLSEGFDNGYDKFLNPTTFTSFTAVAFRSIHSYVQGFLDLVSESRKVTSRIRLSDFFLRPDIVQKKDIFDSLTRGLLTQLAQGQDEFFTTEISEFMFRTPNKTDGLDLISLDLERGRDFGEPCYNKFRQLCGLNKAETFDDFGDQISKANIDALAGLYEHVDDVDFYAAGMLEKPKPGSILGHTFQCVVGEMFLRWRLGDRFYYEFGDQPGSFRLDQLNEIRKTTLALFLCMTSDIQSIQRKAFDVPNTRNPLESCNSIPHLDLSAWKE